MSPCVPSVKYNKWYTLDSEHKLQTKITCIFIASSFQFLKIILQMLMSKFEINEQIHKHTLSWQIWVASQFLEVDNIGEVEESLAINNNLSWLWKKCLQFRTSQRGKGGGGRKRTWELFLKAYFLTLSITISPSMNPKCFPWISASNGKALENWK